MSWMRELEERIDRLASNVTALLTCHATMFKRLGELEDRVKALEGLEEEFSELQTECRIYRRRVKAREAPEVKA